MEDETQVMVREGRYPSVAWVLSQVECDKLEELCTGKYCHGALLASVGNMAKVLQLQMAGLLMLGNMMQLYWDLQNGMVDGDLPVDEVITEGGDGV